MKLSTMFVAVAQSVEELVGRQDRGIPVEVAMILEFLCRAGEQQPVEGSLPRDAWRAPQTKIYAFTCEIFREDASVSC